MDEERSSISVERDDVFFLFLKRMTENILWEILYVNSLVKFEI